MLVSHLRSQPTFLSPCIIFLEYINDKENEDPKDICVKKDNFIKKPDMCAQL